MDEDSANIVAALMRRRGTQPDMRSHTPPWYDRAAGSIANAWDGGSRNSFAAARRFVGPENPFNAPAHMTRGASDVAEGYRRGDSGQMAVGAMEAGMAAMPVLGGAVARARSLAPGMGVSDWARSMTTGSAIADRPPMQAFGPMQQSSMPTSRGAAMGNDNSALSAAEAYQQALTSQRRSHQPKREFDEDGGAYTARASDIERQISDLNRREGNWFGDTPHAEWHPVFLKEAEVFQQERKALIDALERSRLKPVR